MKKKTILWGIDAHDMHKLRNPMCTIISTYRLTGNIVISSNCCTQKRNIYMHGDFCFCHLTINIISKNYCAQI